MAQPARRTPPLQSLARPGADPPLDGGGDGLDLLRGRYAVRRPDEVAAYLRDHPNLVPLLVEAADVIPRYFGPDAPLVLELVTDPEDDAPVPELFALVRTTLDRIDALDRLDRLDADWWTDASPDGPGVLVVSTEFA